MFRIDPDAIVVAGVFGKKTQRMPRETMATCRRRLLAYDAAVREGREE